MIKVFGEIRRASRRLALLVLDEPATIAGGGGVGHRLGKVTCCAS